MQYHHKKLGLLILPVTKICDLVKSQIKSQKFISNPNQIKGFQIKSFYSNQIMIWFCPSLVSCFSIRGPTRCSSSMKISGSTFRKFLKIVWSSVVNSCMSFSYWPYIGLLSNHCLTHCILCRLVLRLVSLLLLSSYSLFYFSSSSKWSVAAATCSHCWNSCMNSCYPWEIWANCPPAAAFVLAPHSLRAVSAKFG